jgi:hypothetical protein
VQVSLKHRFVFLCTPKCASNSIEAMLRPYVDIDLQGPPSVRHTNVQQYQRHLKPYLAVVAPDTEFETVAMVREPISWLYSWYRFRARSALRSQRHAHCTAHVTFSEFVEAYLANPQPPFARVGSQSEFLTDEEGNLGVDHLFAYENVESLVNFFSQRLRQKLALRTINVSPMRVYRSNLLEKGDALFRRLRSRLARGAHVRQTPQHDAGSELSNELKHAMETKISGDFALHRLAETAKR